MKILVVDDNRASAEAMSRILEKHGHQVTTCFDGATAIERLPIERPDLVFTDLKMEPVGGMEVLRAARAHTPPVEVVVFTAFGAVERAVEAMQLGARDFLTKPISVDQILSRVDALQPADPTRERRAPLGSGNRSLLRTLEALASVPSPVWIEGEVGSGRMTAARQLHSLGGGAGDPTVANPAEPASWPTDGTMVLADVDDLPLGVQQRLAYGLRQLPQTVRLVATARPGAQSKVESGALRSDLYFALAVLTVTIPPLRDRRDEIVSLFEEALQRACERYQRPVPTIDDQQRAALTAHRWPGNLKELLNLAESTAVLGAAGFNLAPRPDGLDPQPGAGVFHDGFKLADHLEAIERRLLGLALEQAGGDRTEAGKLLGVERNTLRYKLKKYGLLS